LWKAIKKPGWKRKWNRAYFRRIAQNKSLDRLRKLNKAKRRFADHQRIVPETHEGGMDVFGTENPRVEERELYDERLKILGDTAKTMPLQQRRVARLMLENQDHLIGPKELIELFRKAYRIKLKPFAAKSTLAVVRNKMAEAKAIADRKRRFLAEEDR
jgi:hypothetical protein